MVEAPAISCAAMDIGGVRAIFSQERIDMGCPVVRGDVTVFTDCSLPIFCTNLCPQVLTAVLLQLHSAAVTRISTARMSAGRSLSAATHAACAGCCMSSHSRTRWPTAQAQHPLSAHAFTCPDKLAVKFAIAHQSIHALEVVVLSIQQSPRFIHLPHELRRLHTAPWE